MAPLRLDRLRETLERLRGSFGRKTEEAYDDRDEAPDPLTQSYADGRASAYTDAEQEVRDAESERG